MEEAAEKSVIESAPASGYVELIELWKASVRATHALPTEEDILFYKPLLLPEYLKALRLFCMRDDIRRIR